MGEGHGRHQGIWSGCRRTLSGVAGSGTYTKLSWELERPSLALVKAETRSEPIYNRCSREVRGGQEGVGGGNSSDDGWDNITHPEQRTPTSSTHDVKERNAHEC